MINIKEGQHAKNAINNISEISSNIFVRQWLKETNGVFCIIYSKNNILLCVALLHSLDYDPLNIHVKPILLDYIYTFNNCRRQGHAYSLLKKIIKKNTITAFCNNDSSVALFEKCGCSVINDMARFPPIKDIKNN